MWNWASTHAIKILKISMVFGLVLLMAIPSISNAYVSVKGYYRKNGTYVAPYVRSNPNGLKSDNYGYTGGDVYNKTYGTRGSTWDTPTYITDPNYYEGKALYESNSSGYTTGSTYSYPSYSSSYSTGSGSSGISNITGGYKIGDYTYCNTGYYKKDNQCIKAPDNSTAYGFDNFYCNTGYTQSGNTCVKQEQKTSTILNTTLQCGSGFVSSGGRCVNLDTYCRITYGEGYFYYTTGNSCASCSSGYEYNPTTLMCQTRTQTEVDKNKILQEQVQARLNRKTQNLAKPVSN